MQLTFLKLATYVKTKRLKKKKSRFGGRIETYVMLRKVSD